MRNQQNGRSVYSLLCASACRPVCAHSSLRDSRHINRMDHPEIECQIVKPARAISRLQAHLVVAARGLPSAAIFHPNRCRPPRRFSSAASRPLRLRAAPRRRDRRRPPPAAHNPPATWQHSPCAGSKTAYGARPPGARPPPWPHSERPESRATRAESPRSPRVRQPVVWRRRR